MAARLACPALFVAAPASGQGKTTVTAALARHHRRLGRQVRVFKCGPDFLDPMIHAAASGAACLNLDLGMCGADDAAWRLYRAAQTADLILVEGVMGLFDGTPSGADIARRFALPVLACINAEAMAQTFGAVAHGLATYQPGLAFAGVLANRVGSARHAELLAASLPPGMGWYGALPRDADARLPERHLGVLPASEIADIDARLDRLAAAIAGTAAVDLPPPVAFPAAPAPHLPPWLSGRTLAIARDAAFAFLYPANVELLERLGARCVFFSPLSGQPLPACDAVWLPGGYPELHAARLAEQKSLWAALAAHVAAGKPLLAECGGMMCLFASLVDATGGRHAMAGLLPGEVRMQTRLAALGTEFVDLPEGRIAGHTFHYSRAQTPMLPATHARRPDDSPGEAVYRHGALLASYLHLYFPSAPQAVARLFGAAA